MVQAAVSLTWQLENACAEAPFQAPSWQGGLCSNMQLEAAAICLSARLPINQISTQPPTCLASTMLHTTWLPAANLERRMLLGTRPSTRDSRWHMAASTSLLASVSGFSRLQAGGGRFRAGGTAARVRDA